MIFIEVIQNIILTIPFGFGIDSVAGLEAKNSPYWQFLLGLQIEAARLVISLFVGAYRTVDITDVILNATGKALVGFARRLFARYIPDSYDDSASKPRGFGGTFITSSFRKSPKHRP